MIDRQTTVRHLHAHLTMLTRTIGERSVRHPRSLHETAAYIQAHYERLGIEVHLEPYPYRDFQVSNVVARIQGTDRPRKRYLVGAHYDSVAGTVGADDNASAIAVQLEIARALKSLGIGDIAVTLVSFALEEPPAFETPQMGSRIYARQAREASEVIDGMICLEMVGYTCRQPGCQDYPFPLKYLGYPDTGDFIGIVGNLKSLSLTRALRRSLQRSGELPVVTLTVPFNGWLVPAVRLSDHASFWREGYKAVMVTDSAFFRNPHYHTPADTMDKLDIDYMARLVEGVAAFLHNQGR